MDTNIIRRARIAARITQDHLARMAGVSRRTVARAEAGAVSPESDACLRAALELPPARGRTGPPASPKVLALGWLAGVGDLHDAIDHAASYAAKWLDPYDGLYVGALPFGDGHLFEVQAGGGGTGYLPAARDALATGAEGRWAPSGRRALTVGMRDGQPCILVLPEMASRVVQEASGPMPASLPLYCLARPWSFTRDGPLDATQSRPYGFHHAG